MKKISWREKTKNIIMSILMWWCVCFSFDADHTDSHSNSIKNCLCQMKFSRETKYSNLIVFFLFLVFLWTSKKFTCSQHCVCFFHWTPHKRQLAVYLSSLFSRFSRLRTLVNERNNDGKEIKKLFLWKCVNDLRENGEFDEKVFFIFCRPSVEYLNARQDTV